MQQAAGGVFGPRPLLFEEIRMATTDKEREMLREKEQTGFGERKPWESSRQATYEDTAPQDEHEDDD